MARLRVNPTRMELMRLRRRLAMAVHGHSLLKDKLEGLMAQFMELIARYRAERGSFDEEYPDIARLFLLAGLTGSREVIADALQQTSGELKLDVEDRNVLSVRVPHFEVEAEPGAGYSLLDVPPEFDEAVAGLAAYLPRLVALAELEHSIWLLMFEVERTRRRVNALEYNMIPSLRETIAHIQGKLDENERGNITRLMKIKDMRLAEEFEELRRRRQEAEAART